ncbi:MAG: 16S rRNA (cytidine(1402)-2'-O)-methyltransferase [Bacteroidales bacterium]|nr:16S rRNA (cytidine(1402)-2'-O)-methyltransferase [Bacteroidales bacterium]
MVPTPIGNLQDITLRALDVLKKADLILAEDTRKSSILLKHYQISSPLQSFHKFNEHKNLGYIMRQLSEGKEIALISDAGTPGISDPGFLLVRECIKNEIEVETLPGATAFIPALVNSGLPSERFCFEGFLPQKKGRNKKMEELKEEKRTMIFYESPFRLLKTLELFSTWFGSERKAAVARELTKIHEETVRGSLEELMEYFKEKTIKGEIVIVVEGKG